MQLCSQLSSVCKVVFASNLEIEVYREHIHKGKIMSRRG